jgi:hypothetical protein
MNNQENQDKISQDNNLLEQYKLYVEMMDRVTLRRGHANQFYLSLLSALLGVLTLFSDSQKSLAYPKTLFLLLSLLGLVLCISWWITIHSYKQLNYLKFKVIHEMEKELPFPCYVREWEIEDKLTIKYRRLSKVEKFIPILLGFIYLILVIFSSLKLLNTAL